MMPRRHHGELGTALALLLAFLLLHLPATVSSVHATQEYAERTGKGCIFCHQESTGGQLETVGFTYIRNGYEYPIPERILKFEPFPAKTDWKTERAKMKTVCLQCHSGVWTDDHFSNFDQVIENYNEVYFKPAKGSHRVPVRSRPSLDRRVLR